MGLGRTRATGHAPDLAPPPALVHPLHLNLIRGSGQGGPLLGARAEQLGYQLATQPLPAFSRNHTEINQGKRATTALLRETLVRRRCQTPPAPPNDEQ